MIRLDKTVQINKPIAEVFAFVSDFANDARWQADLISSEKTSSGPLAVGSTGSFATKIMGKEMKSEVQVTAYDPPKRFAAKTTGGPVQIELTNTFEEKDGGTQVAVHMQGEAAGFFKVAEGLLQKEIDKTFTRDLAKLKEVMEA